MLVAAEFEAGQCWLKQYQFDTGSKRLNHLTVLQDCGNAPVTRLTYSPWHNSLYWILKTVDQSSGRLKSLSLTKTPVKKHQNRLPLLDNIYDITASPDGKTLALSQQFQWEHSEVYLYDLTEHQLTKVLTSEHFIYSLSWSRQGNELIYLADNQFKQHDLASNSVNLGFSSENLVREVFFSATDEKMLYVSDKGRYQLQQLDLMPGAKATSLTWGSSQNERNPVFAHHDDRIAFISNRSGRYNIWIKNISGTSYPLKTDGLDLYQTLVRWSPDDKKLLFHSTNALYLYDLITDQYRKLTSDDIYADVVGWSFRTPNTVYLRSDKDGQFNIWQLNIENREMTKVTHDGGFSGNESSDGHYFYYTKHKQNGLWRLDLSTDETLQLSQDFATANHLSWFIFDDNLYYLHGENGPGIYHWQLSENRHTQLWQMPPNHHGGFAVSPKSHKAIVGIKPLNNWDIMQLHGR